MDIDGANKQLSRVKLRVRGDSISVRGIFPPKKHDGDKPKQYEFSLKCKAKEVKIALAKAKAIESDLILERWQWGEESADGAKYTVAEVAKEFEDFYWQTHPRTVNTEYNWQHSQKRLLNYLPQDEIFDAQLIKKAILSYPLGSYSRDFFIRYMRPIAKFAEIDFNFNQFGKYKKASKQLPLIEDIIASYQNEKFPKHKFILGVLATYGLRPHELIHSKLFFEKNPPIIAVGENTKTQGRTVYPLNIPEINVFELPIPDLKIDANLPNRKIGMAISRIFSLKYPFTAYQLRHYYAVRGAMEGISPVTMSKWMGHSLNEHFKSYASLLGDIESEKLWNDKFAQKKSLKKTPSKMSNY